MNWVLYPEVLSIMIAVLAMIGVFGLAFAYGVHHRFAWAQLPAAARDAELATRVMQREAELLDKEQRLERLNEQIRDREAKLLERDQLKDEAEYWKSRIEAIKAEYAGLDGLRAEIEEVRESFRQEMEGLADAERQAREAKGEWEDARMRVADAERRLAEVADAEGRLREAHQELVHAVAELEIRLTSRKAEYKDLLEALERGQDRLSRIEHVVESLDARQKSLDAELRSDEERLMTVKTELGDLEPAREQLAKARESLQSVERDLKHKREILLNLESDEAWLYAQIARRRAELDELTEKGDGRSETDSSLDDLLMPPACLASDNGTLVLPDKQPAEQEMEALQRVRAHLAECGLFFSQRVVNAFHTSLKTAVLSPLTVLAGVSGTGKSQLPRFYADALGLHFLKIPVQPRWDGPQDLFGFYNYIERRYRATDLARALVHLDRYNWSEQAESFDDRVLLVLLDEMNLARVEHYFSEFLSRLEGRPLDKDAANPDVRRPAEIEIDVSRRGQTKRVYAGQNVLFVGTMNEDESTLSLSDKVLDRANVLRFPKPKALQWKLPTVGGRHKAMGHLTKSHWTQGWTRSVAEMDNNARERVEQRVSEINAIMDDMGRPFGHRMGQAILHYCANYPSDPNDTGNLDAIDNALADQIEMRILPRLHGVLVDEQRSHLDGLARVATSLGDKALDEAIDSTARRSQERDGLFVWRGFTRE